MMIYWLYNSILSVLLLVVVPVVPLLFLMGARLRKGFFQRIGCYPKRVRNALHGSRPIWIHAASVGEVLSARSLLAGVKAHFPERKILLSTFTATGNEVARQKGGWDAVIFFPLDHPFFVCRSLKLFDPSIVIFLETEIWPNFLRESYRRGVPTLLLSGRLSARSYRKYYVFRAFFHAVVQQFSALGMQTEADVQRIASLGVDPKKIVVTGNLKHSAEEDEPVRDAGEADDGGARDLVEERRVLVVGSTHRGEEEVFIEVFLSLKKSFPNLLMILAPRHPQRFSEVETLLKQSGLAFEKKSQMNGRSGILSDVIFLDTLGDLPALYSMADVAFVGGSLVDVGGHNVLEPARFRKPVLFGPHMANFMDLAERMKREGGGIEVHGKEDLIREIADLLSDRRKAEKMGEVAYNVVMRDRGAVEQSIYLVTRYL
jgi:3-deoxy-D-manno-octulosonic-acid transferase